MSSLKDEKFFPEFVSGVLQRACMPVYILQAEISRITGTSSTLHVSICPSTVSALVRFWINLVNAHEIAE